jgi:hypothetical protein
MFKSFSVLPILLPIHECIFKDCKTVEIHAEVGKEQEVYKPVCTYSRY